MGSCRYQFNPSETYQRTKPGMGVETHCGGRTYAVADEPEMTPVTVTDDPAAGAKRTVYVRTGRYLPRAEDDPYCPAHGGTPAPEPQPMAIAELEAMRGRLEAAMQAYFAELERAGYPADQLRYPDGIELAMRRELEPARQEGADHATR